MSASKWMKWLSVIALIVVAISFIDGLYTMIFSADDWFLSSDGIILFCLSIWAVIASFKKEGALVTAKKK